MLEAGSLADAVVVDQTAVPGARPALAGETDHPTLTADLAAASHDVLRLLSTRLGMEICLLSLHDRGQYVIVQVVDSVLNLQCGPLRAWEDTICAAMCEGAGPRVAGDVLAVPSYRELVERLDLPVRSYIGTPLCDADGEVIGSLCALSLQPRGEELHQQFDLVRTFGQVLGHLLDRELSARRALLAESAALEQSRTDTLTAALNRRGWQGVLQDVDRWCRAEGQPAAVFVIDIDDLKKTNDRDGHDAGDALLQRAASALTDAAVLCSLRRDAEGPQVVSTPSYAVARTGGDEFAVLLTRFDALECPELADELRRALADAGVAASLGYALRHPVRGLALACRDADQLMLAEKRHRHSRRQPLPAPRTSPEAAPTWTVGVVPDEPSAESIGRLLRRVRELFGLESAFVSRLDEERQTFTHINTDVPLPVAVGDWRPLEISLCQRVMDGRLPSVITDATRHPASADLDVVRAGFVRTYLTVPVRLPDGRLYGTLCCLSAVTRPDITEHAAAALAFAAEQVGELLARDKQNSLEQQAMSSRLSALLESGGLRVALQPVVDLRSGFSVGVEALARFDDGRGPDLWFAEAAMIGQSEQLEIAAFDAAVAGPLPVIGFLAVNVSPPVLMSAGFHERLVRLQSRTDGVLDRLVLELTEHEKVEDYAALAAAMAPFRVHGLRLAVDDTGAGHSSLSHVLQLRPDIMKLDRALVTAIDRDPIRRALVKSLRCFCTDTQVQLVAEGVESAGEAQSLMAIGVQFGQGFHLGRPLLALPRIA